MQEALARRGYAPCFRYRELALAKDEAVARAMAASSVRESTVSSRKRLIERGRLPAPGEGPSEETRARSFFYLHLLASAVPEGGAPPPQLLATVSGGDPGYVETAKMCAEAALLLALRRDELPRRPRSERGVGGVLTPAFALGEPLIDELRARGVCFELLEAAPEAFVRRVHEGLHDPRGEERACRCLTCVVIHLAGTYRSDYLTN